MIDKRIGADGRLMLRGGGMDASSDDFWTEWT